MEHAEIQNLKVQQRLLLKEQISALSAQEKQECSKRITQSLQQELKSYQGKWGTFTALAHEPQVNWEQINPAIDWYFVQTEPQSLKFKNKNETVMTQDLDGICVPGLGFHPNGARLGRGGGYYDRELEKFNKTKIGIAFDLTVREDLPFEPHDVRMNVIVTDKRVIATAGDRKWKLS